MMTDTFDPNDELQLPCVSAVDLELLDLIDSWWQERPHGPSYDWLAAQRGVSKTRIYEQVQLMKDTDCVTMERNKHLTLRLTRVGQRIVNRYCRST